MMPMMVDDDPAIREIFSLFIERQGHVPHTASNGKEALSLLQTVSPDVIVLDIMMQPMDGWDTLTAIRTTPATRDLPVMMFSGKPPTLLDLQQYGSWIDDYLMKPLDFKKLTTTLADLLERNRIQYENILMMRESGADSAVIDEYTALLKSVYIYRKFSASILDEGFENAILLREGRLQQIQDSFLPGTSH